MGSVSENHTHVEPMTATGVIFMVDGGLILFFSMNLLENRGLVHPHSEILCGAALPGAFFPRKADPWVWQSKTVFFAFYQQSLEQD